MRLKAKPGDFRVREVLDFRVVDDGDYFVHVLRKEKLDTTQALNEVARLAGVARTDVAFAGLKDRQGATEQWISIRGRRLDHRGASMQVSFRGRTDAPINSRMSAGNRFEIVVRELVAEDVERMRRTAPQLVEDGMPNYFDDQRFGCLRHGQGFAMRAVLLGDFETALHQLIARPSPVAITGDVKLKRLIAQHWGDWDACASFARGPMYTRLFRHLAARPSDFRGALELLPQRIKLITAFAYQSFLWNRTVDRMLHRIVGRRRAVLETRVGRLAAWQALNGQRRGRLAALATPLPAPGDPGGSREFRQALAEIVEDDGVAGIRPEAATTVAGMVLRAEPRALVLRPQELRLSETARDETEPGRLKVTLEFGLPRGSYATLVVKRLLARPS